jgi:hypothetical protein
VAEVPSWIPQKVLFKAQQLGVHNDCLIAGTEGACPECCNLITLSFDFYYDQYGSQESLLEALLDDYLDEREDK